MSIKVLASDCTRNRRLSRAGKAVQPENAPLISSINPVVYFLEEADAGVGKASGLVLLCVGVEGRFSGVRQ